jgi:hypothetical protein
MTDYTELKRLAEAVNQTYADLCEHGGDELAEAWNSAELAYDDAANPRVVLALIAENEHACMRIKELDLMFGRYLLGMRSSVIEWQHGQGADAAMQWIWNGLAGPGELPPENETQAQAYFDREMVTVDAGLEEVAAFFDARRAAKQVTP